MKNTKTCPDCKANVAIEAAACDKCGWTDPNVRRGRPGAPTTPRHNTTCTWSSGQLQCHYPVGLFRDGALSGWCIFHRNKGEGVEAARIAEDSRNCPPEEYVARAKKLMYGDGSDNASVRSLRGRLTHRATGGHVGLLAQRVLGDEKRVHVEPSEPGSEG